VVFGKKLDALHYLSKEGISRLWHCEAYVPLLGITLRSEMLEIKKTNTRLVVNRINLAQIKGLTPVKHLI